VPAQWSGTGHDRRLAIFYHLKREIHEGFHIAENWIRSKFVFFGKVVNWRQIAFTNKKFRQWLYAESRGLAPLIKAYTNKTFIKTLQSFTSAR
jgi:hypothetical protein